LERREESSGGTDEEGLCFASSPWSGGCSTSPPPATRLWPLPPLFYFVDRAIGPGGNYAPIRFERDGRL